MGIDIPNLLSRETTFLMGILKKCLSVEIAPNVVEDVSNNMQKPSLPVSDQTPGHSGHSVLSAEGAFCHSVTSTEGIFSHSVLPAEGNLLCHSVTSTEDRSQRSPRNCASISDMAELPESNSNSVSGSNLQSLSITDLPLTQEKVESTYADVFQDLGKFPGEPYKLRLKPDAVPVKHRPSKVPVHLQDAFHEEVE